VLCHGLPVAIRPGGRSERLLRALALRAADGLDRDELLGTVWPVEDGDLAGQSLNSLVYALRHTLGEALEGRSPIVRRAGRYRLNTEDGVTVDITEFDGAIADGDRLTRAGEHLPAIRAYETAIALYAGDLAVGSDVEHVVERERLRARYLSAHARLADHYFAGGDYARTLDYAIELLAHDPCREDAHRMAMRCYVRLGERAQALRQYRTCCEVLALEFSAVPEPETDRLYEQVRLEPGAV
jgi:DNA-binding SARP family transcriptional activator